MENGPKRIKVVYEAPDLCREVDDVLCNALGSIGYECGDAGAFFDQDGLERDMEFLLSDGPTDGKLYMGLYQEEVETLVELLKMSIEVEQGMDEPDDDVLSWLHFIRGNLKAAMPGTGCCDEDPPPPRPPGPRGLVA